MKNLSPAAQALVEAGSPGAEPLPADHERVRALFAQKLLTLGPARSRRPHWQRRAPLFGLCVVAAIAGAVGITQWPRAGEKPLTKVETAPVATQVSPEAPTVEVPVIPDSAPVAKPKLSRRLPHRTTPQEAESEPKPLPSPVVTAPPEPSCTTDMELTALKAAQEALGAHQAGKALRVLQPLEGVCGQGRLGEERAAVSILAYCDLGAVDKATEEASSLRADAPVWLRLQTSCVGSR